MSANEQVGLDEVTLSIPPFRLMSVAYESPAFSFLGDSASLSMKPIKNVSETLIEDKTITIEVSFPFRSKLSAVFSSEKGFTRLKIIDCVRQAYRRAYRHASHVPYSTIDYTDSATNRSYYITYPFGSLICEKVVFCKDKGILIPETDSFPNITEEPQTPF